jgi:predicted RNA-binding protein with PUA-like domain
MPTMRTMTPSSDTTEPLMIDARTRYWLLKTEPGSYSIDDLERDGRTFWDGVRNYQARNFLRDELKVGDRILFHHSGAEPPGVVGVARVVREGYPDPTALDPRSKNFDPRAAPEDPRWFMIDVAFEEKFPAVVPLSTLRDTPGLEKMLVINKSRLSVQPVTEEEFGIVVELGRAGSA